MKRIFALILVLATCLSLFSCAETENATATLEETLTAAVKETKKDQKTEEKVTETEEEVEYDHKADVTNIREQLEAIPKVDPSMTTDQLRQICVDYMKLSVSFQWIPDRTFSYSESAVKKFYKGKLEGGIPYINTASCNLYRWLEYYDDETGVTDCTDIERYPLLFGTACSGTAGWAWYRVINSAHISWTSHMNVANGFVIVGDYTYDTSKKVIWETIDGSRVYYYQPTEVCKQNGRQVMYESYAKALLADCFSSGGHVRMAVELPVVVRNEDGTIDGEKSYVMLAEQGLYNTSASHTRYTADGTSYQIRGNDGGKWSFKSLYADGYLIHTFKEFLGLDPAEKGEASIPFQGSEGTPNDFKDGYLVSNYPISDVFVKITAEDGTVKMNYKKRMSRHYEKSVAMSAIAPISYLNQYASEGPCTLEIKVQISTGDLITVFSGPLKPNA